MPTIKAISGKVIKSTAASNFEKGVTEVSEFGIVELFFFFI